VSDGKGASSVEEEAFTDQGVAINSGQFDGLRTTEFKEKITAWLEENGKGKKSINYKLRDWIFSRQRLLGRTYSPGSGQPRGIHSPLLRASYHLLSQK
jgi:leucyl-tRNA synthetase